MNLTPWQGLLEWSAREFSHLPWRKDRSLYSTLVSEIMLQQTTVGTVLHKFPAFMQRFPTIEELAFAEEEEVQMAWKGLGYYRRARNLKRAAEYIVFEKEGQFPMNLDELLEIPGIGPYTAGALIAIGNDQKALAIDANLERVFARLFEIDLPKGPRLQKEIQKRFAEGDLVPEALSPRAINEALMDLGRVYCQARRAHCVQCPLRHVCTARANSRAEHYPAQVAKTSSQHELELLRIVVKKGQRVLGYRKSESEWLSHQIELPTFTLNSTDQKFSQYPSLPSSVNKPQELKSFKTGITKYKITNYVWHLTPRDFESLFGRPEKFQFYLSDPNKENLATSVIKTLEKSL